MTKVVQVILGMILGMGSVFVVSYVGLFIVINITGNVIKDHVSDYGLKQGRLDGTLEIFTKWDPYIDVIGENDNQIVSIDLGAHRISVVKDNGNYAVKKSWSGNLKLGR